MYIIPCASAGAAGCGKACTITELLVCISRVLGVPKQVSMTRLERGITVSRTVLTCTRIARIVCARRHVGCVGYG